MPKRAIGFIPNFLTLCNLLCGCIAIYMTFRSDELLGSHFTGLQWSWLAIAAASVFDFCDGASARGLKAYSSIGKELDSLSDLVSFGVAPGMMILNLMLQHSHYPWLCFAAMLIPAFGAYRLAKFNVDDSQSTSFKGLPIPANAIFWIGAAAWIMRYGYPPTPVLVTVIVIISILMVSNMHMFSLKFKNFDWRENFRRYVLIVAFVAFVVAWGVIGLMWGIVFYIFLSLFGKKEVE